jgi:hypothetical protein
MTKNKTLSISYTPINSIEDNDNRDDYEENDESDCITTPIVVVLNNYNFILPIPLLLINISSLIPPNPLFYTPIII